jgi:hypothetical protein
MKLDKTMECVFDKEWKNCNFWLGLVLVQNENNILAAASSTFYNLKII